MCHDIKKAIMKLSLVDEATIIHVFFFFKSDPMKYRNSLSTGKTNKGLVGWYPFNR
jgi:hypothetical protein